MDLTETITFLCKLSFQRKHKGDVKKAVTFQLLKQPQGLQINANRKWAMKSVFFQRRAYIPTFT